MPNVTFILADGRVVTVQAEAGSTAMLAAVTQSVPGIDAECGGSLACGTCHVYRLSGDCGEPSAAECAMLDALTGERRPNSRLSCQIRLDADTEVTLAIPAEQG
ncbi:hypothetical protein ABB55_07795 [Prosthecomicrobium hirschii]|uniref:2Fe-2S ferredoxin-type domain-containing protein n=1 Tax=Prosthecodimorpha hirschii TaxID=665126 RepID=A0A0P6VSH6_9HYPH|nr:2Fe-2S iron-sulfur cluster-binding protein [Prosthecomicrobium hirschii]KPL55738.1 hypothetical protein ABB55_07795 [Prosthecomicrobium hirschii]